MANKGKKTHRTHTLLSEQIVAKAKNDRANQLQQRSLFSKELKKSLVLTILLVGLIYGLFILQTRSIFSFSTFF